MALLLLAGGCAQDWRPGARVDSSAANAPGAAGASAAVGLSALAPSRLARAVGFASLPDRGDLVAYPKQRVVRQDGAYTWHRAELSEEHALQAIADGSLRMTAPSGEILDFRYERHVEHPSGDWTWVGRLEGGARSDEVIVTFGEKAAFGTIAQPGKAPLKLTIQDGVAWLVETDRSKIADIRNEATNPSSPDYLVPPNLASAGSDTAGSGPMAAGAPVAASATASSGTVIDLVLGYTSGFAASLGGQSQAVTRLNNLVDITNQAYANSQIAGRVRLVHTVQVNYPDNTANDDTLEKLTGYKSGSGWINPDAAFTELRAARDQYGADLVSLVRKFNTPENDGCGIAWLLGGGRTTLDGSDAPFGYSVVSDGRDAGTDGKTYFCREETLAHEIGHNLGSQHDSKTATDDKGVLKYGAFSYSFGFKTDSTSGNFYTVMAYGDSGQTTYRVFSNPNITYCGGFACGVVEQSDNARSHGRTMPVVAGFRQSAVAAFAVPNDFDGDGKSDIYWRNFAHGANDLWTIDGSLLKTAATVYRESDQQWSVAGAGDFNRDGKSDILWRHRTSGQLLIHHMNGPQVLSSSGWSLAVADQNWQIVALDDFDGDKVTDIYWRNRSTGYNDVWLMGALLPRATVTVHREADPTWQVVGSGDFNGDGYADVFWRNASTGRNVVHLMKGAAVIAGSAFTDSVSDIGWKVVAVRDFSGDGRADVYWRHETTGLNYLWTMSGAQVSAVSFVHHEPDTAWRVVNSGDYNGDGFADVLWRNVTTGQNLVHLMKGATVIAGSGQLNRVSDQNWQITGR